MRDVTCFKCFKKGHFAKACPQGTDDKRPNKKAYIAAWSDSNDEDPESWVSPNMCAMAIGEDLKELQEEVDTQNPKFS